VGHNKLPGVRNSIQNRKLGMGKGRGKGMGVVGEEASSFVTLALAQNLRRPLLPRI